jgi:hypothetical protein
MGRSICSRHGTQAIGFAAPSIAEAIYGGDNPEAEPIAWIIADYLDWRWQCPVDQAFLDEVGVERAPSIEIFDEDEAERILGKMSAVCGECLRLYAGRPPILPK